MAAAGAHADPGSGSARGLAPVAAHGVVVIALLRALQHAIPADLHAARRRAAVVVVAILPLVALFAAIGVDHAITTVRLGGTGIEAGGVLVARCRVELGRDGTASEERGGEHDHARA
jgi:hypothetical protein